MPFELAGKTVRLVVDPHTDAVVGVENDKGEVLGQPTPLDPIANLERVRRKPDPVVTAAPNADGPNLVELAYRQYHGIGEA